MDFHPKFYGKSRDLLKEIQYNKCAYCESTMGVAGDGNLHNFRPKSKFPELAYDWNNLFVVCPICSSNKRDQFPLDNRDAPLLVDPTAEDPGKSISFDQTGAAYPKNHRGEVTIAILALNRPELVKARGFAIKNHRRFSAVPDDDEPYAGAIRAALNAPKKKSAKSRKWKKHKAVEQHSASKNSPISLRSKFAYIKSIHIKNFRAIKELKIEFPDFEEERGWQVLLGENAAGKSTVLKAVALALMGSGHLAEVTEYQKGILRRYIVDGAVREASSGLVILNFLDGEKTELKISRSGLKFIAGGDGRGGTIRGYGSMRLLPEEEEYSGMNASKTDVGNLFHPRRTLVNADKLLTGFYLHDRSRFEEFATQINYLLRLQGPLDVVNGELLVPINGTPVRIAELSDGYQAMIALVVDLMNGFEDSKALASEAGILLLDEIGTHLHPRWRLEFVRRLRSTFPGLQVISTTHEPLCLCGLKKGEVGLLQRGSDACVEFLNGDELPNIEGMRVDQILTSAVFGLNSTIDPEIEADFVRYYELLSKHNLTDPEQIQLNNLAIKLKPHRHLAYTRRDQMMYDVIDEFLAKEAKHPQKQKLKKDTMLKLWEIWNEAGVPGITGAAP